MPIFEEVTFKWRDQEYKIPPERVLKCIAAVESAGVTLGHLLYHGSIASMPIATLSGGLGVALRFAGAKVTDEEVYDDLFADRDKLREQGMMVMVMLQALMIPPARLKEAAEKIRQEEEVAGKAKAGLTTK